MTPFTVAVIGDGIAGCAASLMLARLNIPAVWFAPQRSRRQKPGESLSPAAATFLADLGQGHLLAASAHRPVHATFTSWGHPALVERNAAAHPGGMGHVIDRNVFENDLREAAVKPSAITMLADTVRDFHWHDQAWLLRSRAGQQVKARFLIDATGRRSVVGMQLSRLVRQDRMAAAFSMLRQRNDDVDPTPATLIEAVPDGWWYATLLADHRLVLNYYCDPDGLPAGLRRDTSVWKQLIEDTHYIGRWVESAGYTLDHPPELASAGTSWLERAAGESWIAVGDASAALDPLSAHGMTTALWSGKEAALAVARTVEGSTGAFDDYARRVREGVDRFCRERRAIYMREKRFARAPFWQRRLSQQTF